MKFIETYDHLALVNGDDGKHHNMMRIDKDDISAMNLYHALKRGHAINVSLFELECLTAYMIGRLSRSDTCLVFDFVGSPMKGQSTVSVEMRGNCYMPLSVAAISGEKLSVVLKHYMDKGEHRLIFSAYNLFWIQRKLH